jgi:hypothetical protein
MRRFIPVLAPALFAFQCGPEEVDPLEETDDPLLEDTESVDKGDCIVLQDGTIVYLLPQVDLDPIVSFEGVVGGTFEDPTVGLWLTTHQPPEVAQGCFIPTGVTEERLDLQIQCPWMTGQMFFQDEGNDKAYWEGNVLIWDRYQVGFTGQVDWAAQTYNGQMQAAIGDEAAEYWQQVQIEYLNGLVEGTFQDQQQMRSIHATMQVDPQQLALAPPLAHPVVFDPMTYLERPLQPLEYRVSVVRSDGTVEEVVIPFDVPQPFTGEATAELRSDAFYADAPDTFEMDLAELEELFPASSEVFTVDRCEDQKDPVGMGVQVEPQSWYVDEYGNLGN